MENLSYRILFLTIVVSLFGCGKSQVIKDATDFDQNMESTRQIIGGKLVKDSDLITTSVVLIYTLPESGIPQTCTGTFVTTHHILTAAHCVSDIENMNVTQGADPLNNSAMKVFKITKVVRHAKYDENKNSDRNDLAIITIENDDSVIHPVPLPTSDIVKALLLKKTALSSLKSYGYGISQEQSDAPDYKLRQVQLNLSHQILPNEWLVDQVKGRGVCFGDSGGPVIFQKNEASFLVGVASGVQENCHTRSLFINVFYYLDWIVANTSTVL